MLNRRLLTPLVLTTLTAVAHAQGMASQPYGALSQCLLRGFPHSGDNVLASNSGGPREMTALCGATATNQAYGANDQGSAAAYASLNTGKLGAQVRLSTTDIPGSGGISGRAIASMWDTVTLLPGDAVFNYHIPMQLALDGSTNVTLDGPYNTAKAYIDLSVYDAETGKLVMEQHGQTSDGLLFVNADLTPDDLTPLVPKSFQIQYDLRVECGLSEVQIPQSVSADYFHTLRFNWNLPQGTSFTSASGTFNPGAIQSVPEPAPLAAMAVGVLGLLRRRKVKG